MVPSGTGLPEQSLIGSVSTSMLDPAGWTFMRKLQGSDATCCTTRRAETSPTEAVNWAAPSCLPEAALIHATPFLVVTGREVAALPFTPSWKFTGVAAVT